MAIVNPEIFGIRKSVLQVLPMEYVQAKTYPLSIYRRLKIIELKESTEISVAEDELRAHLRSDIIEYNEILDKMLKVEISICTLKLYELRRSRQLEKILKSFRSDANNVYGNMIYQYC